MNSLLGPITAFVAVIALIPLALWLLRRTPLGAAASQGPMRVVAVLALAPNQRLLTVEVGQGDERRWLVLGVTPGGISNLHTLSPQPDAPAAHQAPFASLLARQRRAATGPAESGDAGDR